MIRALALLAALTLTGCVAGSQVLGGSDDEYRQMRADLKTCTLDNLVYELIPDFGFTVADFRRTKCMKGRGWRSVGPGRSGIYDYARINPDAPVCPEHYAWNGNGCSMIARTPSAGAAPSVEPSWATGL